MKAHRAGEMAANFHADAPAASQRARSLLEAAGPIRYKAAHQGLGARAYFR